MPSLLVIAVEDLGFSAVNCSEGTRPEGQSGFEILCDEAVRFTHAYTPATLSQSTLASLLTALYPRDHGIVNNGSSFLSARHVTAAEIALQKSFRTAFFGGGPPVWRNSGLNQGFEVFDDGSLVTRLSLYRQALATIQVFLNWRENEVANRPFFSVLHFADSQFVDTPTVNDLGETRPSTYRSQIEEVNESLGFLFRSLKRDKIWDNVNIVVVGLAGHVAEPRLGDTRQMTLFSERTRVTVFMKPARRLHEGTFNWKVDANISLVDVGATVFDILGAPISPPLQLNAGQPNEAQLNLTHSLQLRSRPFVVSLQSIFDGPEPSWPKERLILTQGDWAHWRGVGPRRLALRWGPYLYLHDVRPTVYNTLVDSLEMTPIPVDDLRYSEVRAPFDSYLSQFPQEPWPGVPPQLRDKLELGHELWHSTRPPIEVLRRLRALTKKTPVDPQLVGWRALVALRMQNWVELKEAGSQASNLTWMYVAAKNLNDKNLPIITEPCLKIFVVRSLVRGEPTLRECPSAELLELFAWTDETNVAASKKAGSMEKFIRFYTEHSLEMHIGEYNHITDLEWDIPPDRPEGPRLVDLILALPEYKKYQQQIQKLRLPTW